MKFSILKGFFIFVLGDAFVYSAGMPKMLNEEDIKQSVRAHISTAFERHLSGILKEQTKDDKQCLINNPRYKASIDNILNEICNSMLGTSSYKKSAKYSNGSKIPEFFESDRFVTISKYKGSNWNYFVLMNLLQNMRNSDITSIVDAEQKNEILDDVVMDIRNAKIRNASEYEYDQPKCIKALGKAKNDILRYFNALNLWDFVLWVKHDYCIPKSAEKDAIPSNMGITKGKLPAGIRNEAATCYFNSVLQTLYNCTPIREAIYKLSQTPKKNRLASEIKKIFDGIASANGRYVDFNGGISELALDVMGRDKYGKPMISNQDPEEAFIKIINRLIEEEVKEEKAKLRDKCSKRKSEITCKYQPVKSEELESNSTIGKICRINGISRVICEKCKTHADTDSILNCLELGMPKSRRANLLSMIRRYECDEVLEDSEIYSCASCNAKCKAQKRFILRHMPKVLFINLKRYYVNNNILNYNGALISCPETMKIRQYRYKLRSYMSGGALLKGGHIVMRGFADDGTKYEANDEKVISIDSINTEKAQFLVYELEEDEQEKQLSK